MVFLKSLKADGLFSYDAQKLGNGSSGNNVTLLSKSTVIVGPNDSGKSNLFRLLELFIQTLESSRRLKDEEIFPQVNLPRLEVKFRMSETETSIVIDFLSFFRERTTNPTMEKLIHYDFRNRLRLTRLLQDVCCKITWQLTQSYDMAASVEIEFEKIGLKFLATNYFGTMFLGTKFDSQTGRRGYDQTRRRKLFEFLDSIADEEEGTIRSRIDEFFNEAGNLDMSIENLSTSYTQFLTEDEIRTLIAIYDFRGADTSRSQEVSFLGVIGSILSEKMFFTTGGRILGSSDPRVFAEEENSSAQGHHQLFQQNTKTTLKLKPNGSNLAQFLFDLKESEDPVRREKFKLIQERFNALLNE
jgi:energy-coupling factor transporter ATP-binding protein EcfA2